MRKTLFLTISILLFFLNGIGQIDTCNRSVIDRSLVNKLPKGICIPQGYIINKIYKSVNSFDGLVLRYTRTKLKDGDTIYYSIFFRENDNFTHVKTLTNLEPLYLKSYFSAYGVGNKVASSIIENYPKNVEVIFNNDSIIIHQHLYDVYGKSFYYVFKKEKKNWFLVKMSYWIGDLDPTYIERMNISEKLIDKVFLENVKVSDESGIDKFNLINNNKTSEEEGDYLINKFDISKWSR